MSDSYQTLYDVYVEMQKGYDTNQAMTVVINGSRLDPEVNKDATSQRKIR